MSAARTGWAWRKFWTLVEAEVSQVHAYSAALFIWMLSGTLSVVMMLIWMRQAASAPDGQVSGYTAADFAAYFLASWLIEQLVTSWVSGEMSYQIRSGRMSLELLRPLDPLWAHLAAHIGEWLARVLPMLLIFGAGWRLTGARFSAAPGTLLACGGLVALGFAVRFLLDYCLGLLAFWTESMDAYFELSWLLYTVLGGVLAPLSLFPDWVQKASAWTPFPYLVSLPTQLLTGKADPTQAGHIFMVLSAWFFVLFLLRRWLFQQGVQRYAAVGG